MNEPVYRGFLQSDLDFNGFSPLNLPGWPPSGGGGGSNPLITINVKDSPYSAVGDGVADDSVAIQAALTAAAAAGGGTVFFPKGIYKCEGAFNGTSGSILTIPFIGAVDPITIVLQGEYSPAWTTVYGFNTECSMIVSDKTGAGTHPALLSTGPWEGPFAASDHINNTMVVIKNIFFRANNSMDAVRLDSAAWADLENIRIDSFTAGSADPPTAGHYGLIMPGTNNSGLCRIKTAYISAFDTGIRVGEHFFGETVSLVTNYYAVEFTACYQTCRFISLQPNSNKYNFRFTGGVCPVMVECEIEYAPGGHWYTATGDIVDPSNYGRGEIKYVLVQGGSGTVDSGLIRNGGIYLLCKNVHAGLYTVSTLPGSPSVGQEETVSDGTASLAWGATVTGGGSTKYRVWWNGSNWTVLGK